MNIGINCCHLSDRIDGARTRIIEIYSSLIPKRKNDIFIFFIPKNLNLKKFKENLDYKNVLFHRINIRSNNIFKRFFLGFYYWGKMFDIYKIDYFDHSYLPLFIFKKKLTKIILTIHDLRYLKDWKDNFLRFMVFRIVMKLSLYNCSKVITVSNTIKKELSNFYKKKIYVIYNFIKTFKKKKIKKNMNNFIFSIGHAEKRKNLENLIRAFVLVKSKNYSGNLIICTNNGNNLMRINQLVKNNPYSDSIKLLINKNNLFVKNLYENCELFILPSYYEGFGIPIIEAAIFNKPILTSNLKVFKEVTLGRSKYFDPSDPTDISAKINLILNNKVEKKKLEKNSILIQKKFNEKKIIKKFSNLFK